MFKGEWSGQYRFRNSTYRAYIDVVSLSGLTLPRLLCMSHGKIWISNVIHVWRGLFFFFFFFQWFEVNVGCLFCSICWYWWNVIMVLHNYRLKYSSGGHYSAIMGRLTKDVGNKIVIHEQSVWIIHYYLMVIDQQSQQYNENLQLTFNKCIFTHFRLF